MWAASMWGQCPLHLFVGMCTVHYIHCVVHRDYVLLSGKREAIILYIGAVHFAEGIWFGVELIDGSLGIHGMSAPALVTQFTISLFEMCHFDCIQMARSMDGATSRYLQCCRLWVDGECTVCTLQCLYPLTVYAMSSHIGTRITLFVSRHRLNAPSLFKDTKYAINWRIDSMCTLEDGDTRFSLTIPQTPTPLPTLPNRAVWPMSGGATGGRESRIS